MDILQVLCRQHDDGGSNCKTYSHPYSKTWDGTPKGRMPQQTAWEQGLLDLDSFCVEDFSEKGLLDYMENRIEKTNLSILLTNCSDFDDEESLLQLNIRTCLIPTVTQSPIHASR